jgi:prephenate dehydratase
MRIGFLGPAGTFTHEALRGSSRSAGAELIPFPTERATILAVAEGDVDFALVPVENALEGTVRATLDTLAFDAPGVVIVGEELLAITHCLIAAPGVIADDLDVVVSHPQALAQCARYLREVLTGRRLVASTSTAEAVREAVAVPPTEGRWAAIGTRAAAALHGGEILVEGIEDEPGNATRFVWLARAGDGEPAAGTGPARRRTSIVFHGDGDGAPGWLVRCLSEFSDRELNLSRIESRPSRRRLGHYLFLVDLEDARDPAVVTDAIAALRVHCEDVRVLGSYPIP